MVLPISIAIKSFLGVCVLTPFEQQLLKRLGDALEPTDRDVLTHQLANFTTVRRLTRHLDEPKAHGFTNFYTLRFGKDVFATRQLKRFTAKESETLLATAHVTFDGGEIDVQFWLVRGVFFNIEYRSLQKIYYPPEDYRIDFLTVWPSGKIHPARGFTLLNSELAAHVPRGLQPDSLLNLK